MNAYKIAFLTCVNDVKEYEEAVYYIRSLAIPEGYEIELIAIEGARSMTAGYNEAMRRSDARYKVYVHQDVRIIHRQFIADLLAVFQADPGIGMLGVIGASTIPASGIWWESDDVIGKVYDNHSGSMVLLANGDVLPPYANVQALDGLLMATCVDIEWREDLFEDWHFYDVSQCMEVTKAGYAVVVPHQTAPWCLHDCGIPKTGLAFAEARALFCQVYLSGQQ